MTTAFLRHVPFVLVLVLLFSPSTVSGQTSNEEDEPKTPPWLLLAFEQRTRVEALTNRFRIDELGPTRVLAFRTRLYFEIRERTDPFRFVVELQDSRSELTDDPFIVPRRHINKLDFLQLQLQLVSDRFFGTELPTALQIGRFTMDLGKRRLSARNRMRNTTNAFDGFHWWLGTDERWMFRVSSPGRSLSNRRSSTRAAAVVISGAPTTKIIYSASSTSISTTWVSTRTKVSSPGERSRPQEADFTRVQFPASSTTKSSPPGSSEARTISTISPTFSTASLATSSTRSGLPILVSIRLRER